MRPGEKRRCLYCLGRFENNSPQRPLYCCSGCRKAASAATRHASIADIPDIGNRRVAEAGKTYTERKKATGHGTMSGTEMYVADLRSRALLMGEFQSGEQVAAAVQYVGSVIGAALRAGVDPGPVVALAEAEGVSEVAALNIAAWSWRRRWQ